MAHISGGKMTYERRVKTGEYEHKHGAAEISFVVEPGENHEKIMDIAAAHAHGSVIRLLGLSDGRLSARPPSDKDRLATEVGGAAAAQTDEKAPKKSATKPPAPAAVVDPAGADVVGAQQMITGTTGAQNAAEVGDPLTSEPPPINDVEFTTAISKHNGETKNTAAIRALIAIYTPQDGQKHQAAEIPQEKRRPFLTELHKIGKLS